MMVGVKARMEVHNNHDEVIAKEDSILPEMKEETLELGRQLRKDCKYHQRKIVLHAEENSCSSFPRASNRRDANEG